VPLIPCRALPTVSRPPVRCHARAGRALAASSRRSGERSLARRPTSRRCFGHWPRAYRAAFLIVHDHAAAEDIAQEAFVQAIRRLDRFDRRRRFAPWLGTIVANRAIDWARARAARRESGHELPEPAGPPERPVGRYSEEVLAALSALTPEHRAVVVMRYVLEYTPGEIANALELPRGTVNSRLRRGLDALEAALARTELR
jgi:RNA polymerase sigma-70 factor, ECF subfamily